MPDRHPERRQRWISAFLTAGVLSALVGLAVAKIDWHALPRALSDVNIGWLAVAGGLTAASNLARAESWFAVIRAALPHQVISRAAVARSLLIGAATSSVTPARLGEAARAWLIARRLGGAREALATVAGTVVAQALLNLLALLILAVLVLAASTIPGARTAAIAAAAVLPAVILAALLAGPRLTLAASRVRGRRGRRLAMWVGRQLIEVRGGLVAFRRPGTAAHAAAPQLGAWTLQFLCCYAVLLALGLHPATPLVAAAVLLAVNLTAILPLTPSNVGVYQAACIAVLAPFGINAGHALAYGLVLQAVEIVSGLALGLPALAHEGLSLRELRREASAASSRAVG